MGENNERELVNLLLPGLEKPFPGMNMDAQSKLFKENSFDILESNESYTPIKFYDVGALVWFAKVIPWEFTNFSVDNCLHELFKAQEEVEKNGY